MAKKVDVAAASVENAQFLTLDTNEVQEICDALEEGDDCLTPVYDVLSDALHAFRTGKAFTVVIQLEQGSAPEPEEKEEPDEVDEEDKRATAPRAAPTPRGGGGRFSKR